jgi:hypothetical protein
MHHPTKSNGTSGPLLTDLLKKSAVADGPVGTIVKSNRH